MIGILVLIFIGRSFYKLAVDFERKNTWLYPVIGIVSYYGGSILAGIVIAVILTVMNKPIDEATLGLAGIPFGIGICWGLYAILKYNWKKERARSSEVLDDQL